MSNTTVEDFIDMAIVEGFSEAFPMFYESLENELRNSIIISEAGNAQALLQAMIDIQENEIVEEESVNRLEDIATRVGKLIKR